jgi:hypothetical protein
MSLGKDIKFCMKLNRFKEFLLSPQGILLIIALVTIAVQARKAIKES